MTRPPNKGLIIRPDKTVIEKTFRTLQDYNDAVGGYIEAVRLRDGTTIYVNEEGLYLFTVADFNSIATDVAGLGGRTDLLFQGLLGPAVVVGPPNQEGWDTSITPTGRRWVELVMEEAGGTYVREES